jgi:hypothetical protein
MTKIDPQQNPRKMQKMEPGTGGEKPRSGRAQGAFMTRSRVAELGCLFLKKKNHHCGECHVECERSDVRDVLCRHAQHTHRPTYPTWGAHESRHVRAQRSVCGYHKSREDFLIRSFMTTHRLVIDTRDHNNLTAPRVLCNNTLQQE